MAESSDLVDGAAAVDRVTLTWTEWFQLANVPHESTYWLSGSELKRDFDGTVSTVARNISGVGFSQADRVITLVITSTPKWSFTRSVERTFRVGLRPKG